MLMGWNATFQKMLGINYIVISSYQTLEIKQEESFVVKIYNLKKKKIQNKEKLQSYPINEQRLAKAMHEEEHFTYVVRKAIT
jgi:hypothetical protein